MLYLVIFLVIIVIIEGIYIDFISKKSVATVEFLEHKIKMLIVRLKIAKKDRC